MPYQVLRFVHHGVAVLTKQHGQVVVGLFVDGDAKRDQARSMRLAHCLARVFQTVTTLIDVQVIGFAIGEQHQQALALGAVGQLQGGVANGCAHAGVITRFDRANTGTAGIAPALIKRFKVLHAHMLPTHRAEAPDGERVTSGVQRLAKHKQRITDHINDPRVRRGVGIGGQGQVGQQQGGQTAVQPGAARVDRRCVAARGGSVQPVGLKAHPGIQIQVVTAVLAMHGAWGVAQNFQAAAQAPGCQAQSHRGHKAHAILRLHHLHQAVPWLQYGAPIVPLRQSDAWAHRHVVGAAAGQIQVKFDT